MVGSSLPAKKLNDNNCTKLRSRGWWGRWWSLGNLEIIIIKACHYNQCGGWTNKHKLTTHTPCREIEYQQKKIQKYLKERFGFCPLPMIDWWRCVDIQSKWFSIWTKQTNLNYTYPVRKLDVRKMSVNILGKDSMFVLLLWLVGEDVLISDPSGFQFGSNLSNLQ